GKTDPLVVPKKAALSRDFQASTAFVDSSGHCLFITFATGDLAEGFEGLVEECAGALGTDWKKDDVYAVGYACLRREREFNAKAGFSDVDDRMPEFMKREALPPHNTVWDVPDEDLDWVHKY
ncbi:MAG: hypothetical protein M0Z94_18535, partial [Dehalococcoidales bacterium]|nr:hypothetical protein [Dehalococcoidales bacterium]